jgi:hypothetical protein
MHQTRKNAARLPNYHRLDAAANYTWPLGAGRRKATIGVSVFNAYNRQHVWYKEFTVVEGEIVENNINLTSLTLNAFFLLKRRWIRARHTSDYRWRGSALSATGVCRRLTRP